MIFQKIKDINATGVAVILVEQNAKEALSMADRGYILVSGRNALDGEGRALLEDAEVGRLYLGG
jgi:ABC-type branched-subunit amino acid transport system ATPase component